MVVAFKESKCVTGKFHIKIIFNNFLEKVAKIYFDHYQLAKNKKQLHEMVIAPTVISVFLGQTILLTTRVVV